MKIDTHQHYWQYKAEEFPWISPAMPALQSDCLPNHRQHDMRVSGVQAAIAVQARTLAAETDSLLGIAAQSPEVVGVIGWADLRASNLQQQLDTWCAQAAFKGLRHILQDEPDVAAWVGDAAIEPNMVLLQQRGLVYEVLVFERQIPSVINFCARHDKHWLVLDHLGKPALRDWAAHHSASAAWRQSLRALAAMPHVVCKLSGLVTETDWSAGSGLSDTDADAIMQCFDIALEAFGPNRLMFGSDWPVCQLAASYQAVHGLAQRWAHQRLSAYEQAAFWSGNAVRCYNLKLEDL